jgi:hypothetical protein
LLILGQISMCAGLVAVRGRRLTAAIAVAGVALALLGGVAIYQSSWSYARVFVWMPLAIWLWSMQSGRSWPVLLLTSAVLWPILASLEPWLK